MADELHQRIATLRGWAEKTIQECTVEIAEHGEAARQDAAVVRDVVQLVVAILDGRVVAVTPSKADG